MCIFWFKGGYGGGRGYGDDFDNGELLYECDVLWCTSVSITVVISGLLPQLQAQEVIMQEDRVTAEAEGVTGAVVQDTAVREVVLVEVMVATMAVS